MEEKTVGKKSTKACKIGKQKESTCPSRKRRAMPTGRAPSLFLVPNAQCNVTTKEGMQQNRLP
jgi:hypothetical protein